MILIFVEEISERLIYTLDFVLSERGYEYTLTNDPNSFLKSPLQKLNYSERYFDDILFLIPATVLFDEEVIVYNVHSSQFENEDCLNFSRIADPLASIFYVLSRLEEYSSTVEDEHGRFLAKNSILDHYKWLDKAMCDRWAEAFLRFLNKNKLLSFESKRKKVEIIPTFDIDNAYAFQLKTGIRMWLSTLKDIVKRNRVRLKERKNVLSGNMIDPYDTYDYILSIAERGYKVKLFWLLGDYAKYDKNISFKNARHQRLIRKMDQKITVGIHPSYKSNSYEYYLFNEKERLEEILNHPVENSRQHFLKLKLPTTYNSLNSLGIKHDFTMGYAEKVGFRAGTARPFKWFDLTKNKVTDLTIHPFVYMDGTLNEYLSLEIESAKDVVARLYEEIAAYGGDYMCIWHNETIGNYGHWKGWKEILEFTMNLNKGEDE